MRLPCVLVRMESMDEAVTTFELFFRIFRLPYRPYKALKGPLRPLRPKNL